MSSVCSVDSARFCFQLVFFPGAGFPLKLRPPKGHLDSVASEFGFVSSFLGAGVPIPLNSTNQKRIPAKGAIELCLFSGFGPFISAFVFGAAGVSISLNSTKKDACERGI